MNRLLKGIAALVTGLFLGWGMLAGFCNIPGLKFSVACGHNAYIWLPLFIPLGIYVCWYVLGAITGSHNKTNSTKKGVESDA